MAGIYGLTMNIENLSPFETEPLSPALFHFAGETRGKSQRKFLKILVFIFCVFAPSREIEPLRLCAFA